MVMQMHIEEVRRPPDKMLGGRATQRAAEPFLVPLMSGKDRVIFWALAFLWAAALLWFWEWWLRPEHNLDGLRFLINSLVLLWTTVIPGYFLLIFARSRVSNQAQAIPAAWRVAMVVTKAPSEPAEMVQKTLTAMLAQRHPHDTWLADEDPSPEILAWCARHGMRVSTRRNVAEYHNKTWPRRTKSKEGNLSYFYDKYGYANYDIVVQLDADHVPAENYLEEMIRPFLDPKVGYVSAPSICDSNAAESWSARGRLYVEGALHGALQAGYNGGLAPLCIGSHYAVRTTALKEIDGLGPELAEDHSTTLIMNAHGWRGVHALNAIAHGDGPRTFYDLAIQEFQWARSLFTIFLRHMPIHLRRLPMALKAQFLFSEAWYPLFTLSMLVMVLIPIVALLTKTTWVNVVYAEFFLRGAVVTLAILLVMRWVRRKGWNRPADAKVLSWEGAVFLFARWPWALLGIIAATADAIKGKESGFRVTPKGKDGNASLPFLVILPYLFISLVSALPVILRDEVGNAGGFYVFSLINSVVYLGVAVVIVVMHEREQKQSIAVSRVLFSQHALVKAAAFAAVFVISTSAAALRLPVGIEGLLWGMPSFPSPNVLTASLTGRQRLALGVYDPKKSFADADYVAIEHIFVSWLDDNGPLIKETAEFARQRNRWLMITVEPWSDRQPGGGDLSLLSDVVGGRYDQRIEKICQDIAALETPLFVRWGHEMEVPTGRYPWAHPDGQSFIDAYRRFVDKCRAYTDRIFYVWSPRGDHELDQYFPGKSYADYVGVSVYSFPDWEIGQYGRIRSVAKNFAERYDRIRKYDKPVMIAELGITGSSLYQRSEAARAFADLQAFPLLQAVVYFNAVDSPGAWEARYGVPDWSIDQHYLMVGRR